jgi:hypothetical protein
MRAPVGGQAGSAGCEDLRPAVRVGAQDVRGRRGGGQVIRGGSAGGGVHAIDGEHGRDRTALRAGCHRPKG